MVQAETPPTRRKHSVVITIFHTVYLVVLVVSAKQGKHRALTFGVPRVVFARALRKEFVVGRGARGGAELYRRFAASCAALPLG